MKKNVAHYLLVIFVFIMAVSSTDRTGAEENKRYKRSIEKYEIPDVILVDQNREKRDVRSIFNEDKPVIMDFIFTTCTTICPVHAAGFSNMQKELGAESLEVSFVSISIDPEHDSPDVMKAYLKKFEAMPGWDFYTGSKEDITRIMKAFDVYVQNKMSHLPVTILKAPGDDSWVRIYGLVGTSELMDEYRTLKK